MRFMVMHKISEKMEAGYRPPQAEIEKMGQLIQAQIEAGVFVDGAGLKSGAERVRLTHAGGKFTEVRGRLVGNNEVPAAWALMRVKTMDEAVGLAQRFAKLVGDVEVDLGPITEPWDLGLPKPPGELPLHVLSIHKATRASEAGEPLSPEAQEALFALTDELRKAGKLLSTGGLEPSAKAARLRYARGRTTVVDGPFTESKELIAGYSIVELPSMKEAIAFTTEFARLLGELEGREGVEVDIWRVAQMMPPLPAA